MPDAYDSKYTGAQIDNLQSLINALNAALSNINNNVANVGVTLINFNNLSNTVSSIQSNYATKALVNSVICIPGNIAYDVALINSGKKTSITTALSNWSPPSNGWLIAYFNNCSGAPEATIQGGGLEARLGGNNTREFSLSMPVKPSSSYTIYYVYCGVAWASFLPALLLA